MSSRTRDPLDRISPRGKSGSSVFSQRKSAKITDLSTLTATEVEFARAYSAALKATGWSWRYISDTLNIQGTLIKAWADDEEWQKMLAKVASDNVAGAIDHLKRHAVDFIEMLAELARSTTDDAVKLRAIEAGLDRMGISKVNKSESSVTNTEKSEVAFGDGFMERLQGLPLETQTQVAEMMSQVDNILAEGATKK